MFCYHSDSPVILVKEEPSSPDGKDTPLSPTTFFNSILLDNEGANHSAANRLSGRAVFITLHSLNQSGILFITSSVCRFLLCLLTLGNVSYFIFIFLFTAIIKCSLSIVCHKTVKLLIHVLIC